MDKKFKIGDLVRKIKGSQWSGRVVGGYSTDLTPEGYAVESMKEKGSVQIYPGSALELDTAGGREEGVVWVAISDVNGCALLAQDEPPEPLDVKWPGVTWTRYVKERKQEPQTTPIP